MKTLLKFELLQLLRDKKTIFFIFILPIIVFPLINGGLMFLTKSRVDKIKNEEITVLFDNNLKNNEFIISDSLAAHNIKREFQVVDTTKIDTLLTQYTAVLMYKDVPDSLPLFTLYYSSKTDEQGIQGHKVASFFSKQKLNLIEKRFNDIGIEKIFDREKIAKMNIAQLEQTNNYHFSSSLPITLLIVLVIGSFTLANYIILGEKDNKTLELLLASGASRHKIMQGKFIIIFSSGIIMSILELLSFYVYTQFIGFSNLQIFFSPLQVSYFVILALTSSLFITTFTIFISSKLKSTTAGQIVMTPVFILVLLLSLAGVFDGIEVSRGLLLIPILNSAAILKKIILDRVSTGEFLLVNIALLSYTILLFKIAVNYLNSEAILSTEDDIEKDVVKARKQNMWLAYALIVVVYYLIGGYMQSKNIIWGLILSQILILGGGTLVISKIHKISYKDCFKFKTFEFKYIFYAIIMGLFLRFPMQHILEFFSKLFPIPDIMNETPLPAELLNLGIFQGILIIALLPAFFEEFLYRGVFVEMSNKKNIIKSSILIGLMFGFMHLNIFNLVGTSLLGIVLTLLVFKSGSIIPAIIMHFLNNASSVVLMYVMRTDPDNKFIKLLDSSIYSNYVTIIMVVVLIMFFHNDLKEFYQRFVNKKIVYKNNL